MSRSTRMKGLADLSALAAAPALRRLAVASMPQLTVESFRCFIGHPRLEELWAYTGKSSVNEQVKRMFPLIARSGNCGTASGLGHQAARDAPTRRGVTLGGRGTKPAHPRNAFGAIFNAHQQQFRFRQYRVSRLFEPGGHPARHQQGPQFRLLSVVSLPPRRRARSGLCAADHECGGRRLSEGLGGLPRLRFLRSPRLVPRADQLRRDDPDDQPSARVRFRLLRLFRALLDGTTRAARRRDARRAAGAARSPGRHARRTGHGPPACGRGRPRQAALLGHRPPASRRDHGGMVDGRIHRPAPGPGRPGGAGTAASGRSSTSFPT